MRSLLLTLMLCSSFAMADIQVREIPYTAADGTQLIGYHAWDDAIAGPRPGVVVVHEWWGLNDYAKRRARDLAALGYSALAIDMYGQGRNTQHPEDAGAFMQAVMADPKTPRARFQAGLELLKKQSETDPQQLAAIGYCFGGRVVLDMARQGLPLAAVVSFHGALATDTPATSGSVKARVLVEHGSADSFITPQQIVDFKAEMDKAGANYRFVELPGAKHGFSNPDADAHKGHGLDLGYQKEADERSWADMQQLFAEVFPR